MLNLFFLNVFLVQMHFLWFSVFSCKKKEPEAPSVIGLDVQPENDLVGVTITDSAGNITDGAYYIPYSTLA